MVADICNAPAVVLRHEEGAAFGAALQALEIIESGSDIVELAKEDLSRNESRCHEPDVSAVNIYRDTYQEYKKAVDAVASMYT